MSTAMKASSKVNGGLRLTVTCSAMRRVSARKLGDILREVAANWVGNLETLAAAPAA